jgi:hypothetical protein
MQFIVGLNLDTLTIGGLQSCLIPILSTSVVR